MKNTIIIFGFALLCLPLISVISGCDDDDMATPKVGDPEVYYVRTTNPESGDSLLTGAFMGSTVAIIGNDLAATVELWFNDQKSTLNPTYVTNETIIASVPSTVPTEVNNKMRLVFSDGSEYLYDFRVNVPGPVITGIKSEFVPDGGTAVIYGDFFFEPVKVVFPEGLEGQNVTVEKTFIEVIVPEGSTSGQITVETNFGTAKSSFYFRDDRNIILDYDTRIHETWTAPMADGPDPVPCSGNYAYFKHNDFGAWVWTNEMTMQYWAPRGRGNIPVAVGNKNDLVLKFEINVPVDWIEVPMRIFFGPYAEDHGHDVSVHCWWQPWASAPFRTNGWQTVTIPLTEFNKDRDGNAAELGDLSTLTNVTMMLFGDSQANHPVYIAFDNVRIVPK